MTLHAKLEGRVGPPVSGDLFFDREHEVAELLRLVRGGHHVLISAMRRIGKTSLMREVQRHLSADHLCVAVDVEGCRDATDALVELAAAVQPTKGLGERVLAGITGAASKVQGTAIGPLHLQLRDALVGDWKPRADALITSLAGHDRRVVVFIDELAVLVQRMLHAQQAPEVDRFISWLRQATQHPDGRVSFVVAGSIGLEPILRRAGLSGQINTFTSFHLDPWDEATSIAALRALAAAREVAWHEAALRRAFALLGCGVPHHVQLFAQKAMFGRRSEVDVARVEQVWRDDMIGPRGHPELSHVGERLRLVLAPAHVALAEEVLTHAAQGAWRPGAATTPELREVLFVLEHDGYLRRTDEGWVFVSNLVRAWWQRQHGPLDGSPA